MKKDIEKYIDENINAELPENLTKDNIVSKLVRGPEELKTEKKNKKSKFLKAVSLVAALALVMSGVLIYRNQQNSVETQNTTNTSNDISVSDDYSVIYSKMKDFHKAYKSENRWNIFAYGNKDEASVPKDFANINGGAEIVEETADSVANGYGTTNTQEEGVDEGDIIKTDGKNIYIADVTDNSVFIVDAKGEMKSLATIKIEKEGCALRELYLSGDKLFIIYSIYKNDDINYGGVFDIAYYGCCRVAWLCSDTYVDIYDIKNPEKPGLISSNMQSGEYVSSRLTGGKLYSVSSYGVDIAKDDYKDNCIPKTAENGNQKLIPSQKITVVNGNNSPTYAVITVTDMKTAKQTDSSAIFGDPTNVYATEKSLYVTETLYDEEKCTSAVKILKFKITENGTEFAASAVAEGRINDNLSMSEQGDYFCIATTREKVKTSGIGPDKSVSYLGETNSLYVFDADMNRVGLLPEFADGEQIRSCRYVGKFAYIVTFRQTDPLFVIDLTDAKSPKIVGELTLPGFSSYLHPLGDGTLIGIGADGTEDGTNGNMKVSLFSVADARAPKEISNIKVGKNGSYVCSNISSSYKSFVSLPNGEFAVPFTVYDINFNTSKAMFIRYSAENGELKETVRYVVGDNKSIVGGTYIGNYFFVFSEIYREQADEPSSSLEKFDLNTNESVCELVLG